MAAVGALSFAIFALARRYLRRRRGVHSATTDDAGINTPRTIANARFAFIADAAKSRKLCSGFGLARVHLVATTEDFRR